MPKSNGKRKSTRDQREHLTGNQQALTSRSLPTMSKRFLGNELKVPDFYGNPADFGPFWELFEELLHKQPYANIEKLSILHNCCKGDAAPTLQMIPRRGDSYDRAVEQLKSQYHDPKRITVTMIKQLKSMKQCRDESRSLRNNLSDIQAIVATLQRQGEIVNTTHLMSMVLDTFSKNVQDKLTREEFDSGQVWDMTTLLEHLTVAVRP
ncbi:hypothetical protein OSTOST_01111 [Ostertagia ostertagi]